MLPLDRETSFQKIAKMFGAATEIVVAAPYFGEGAAEQLGLLKTSASVTVVCDLFSGGCNPNVIEKIRKAKAKPDVQTLRGLHAKIYLTDREVVIGSANPSSNGLCFEGKELVGNIEGCVHSDDPAVIEAWRVFFNEKILAPAVTITDQDIERALPLFLKNRKRRTRSDVGTLRAEMKKRDFFKGKDIYFVWYSVEDAMPLQDEAIKEEQRIRESDKISCYFNWDVPKPGAYLIDFTYRAAAKVDYTGIWRVVDTEHIVPFEAGTKLVVSQVDNIQGLTIPKADQIFFRELIKSRLDEEPEGYVSAYEIKTGEGDIVEPPAA